MKYSFDFQKLYNDYFWTIQEVDTPLINKSVERALEIKYLKINKKLIVYFLIFSWKHYRFLAGLIQYNKPKFMIDIGTSTGMSSRIMLDYSDSDAKVLTYDLINWYEFNSHLTNKDF